MSNIEYRILDENGFKRSGIRGVKWQKQLSVTGDQLSEQKMEDEVSAAADRMTFYEAVNSDP